jgi:crotonobetainyl-CoA:carnitine CoA-transferase CaiB-like acyl-CoA transferase
VILLNLVARAQRKLGLDAASLRKLNPRLVHVSISGFGLQGSRADLPCYDLIAEGYSSVMDLTGEPENGPQKVGTPAADLLAGSDAAMAVVAALLRREREGKGCDIDISMVESMSRFMTPKLMPYLGSGDLARRAGGRDSVIAIYQVFDTADAPMTLGLGNDARSGSASGRPWADRRWAPTRCTPATRIAARSAKRSWGHRRASENQATRPLAGPAGQRPRAGRPDPAAGRSGAGPGAARVRLHLSHPGPGWRHPAGGPGHPLRRPHRRHGHAAAQAGRAYRAGAAHWLGCDADAIAQLRNQQII